MSDEPRLPRRARARGAGNEESRSESFRLGHGRPEALNRTGEIGAPSQEQAVAHKVAEDSNRYGGYACHSCSEAKRRQFPEPGPDASDDEYYAWTNNTTVRHTVEPKHVKVVDSGEDNGHPFVTVEYGHGFAHQGCKDSKWSGARAMYGVSGEGKLDLWAN